MSRDAKLVPRLLEILDTIENPAEIAATVCQLRRILGAGGFAAMLAGRLVPMVALSHADHAVATRLRGLGLGMRWAQHADRRVSEAIQRVGYALTNGATAEVDDLVLTLAFMAETAPEQSTQSTVERFDVSSDLRRSMGILNTLVRER